MDVQLSQWTEFVEMTSFQPILPAVNYQQIVQTISTNPNLALNLNLTLYLNMTLTSTLKLSKLLHVNRLEVETFADSWNV